MSTSHRLQRIQKSHRSQPNQLSQRTAKNQIRQIQESGAVPAKLLKAEAAKPRECFESFQLKYDIDASAPWWKRLFFWYVYMPFVRFAFFKMRIVPMDHQNERRELGWLERQGVWSEEWQAELDAARYPFGGVERLSFNAAEDDCTCAPRSQFPNSTAKKRYERNAHKTISVTESSLERLSRKLLETDSVVDRYRTKSA